MKNKGKSFYEVDGRYLAVSDLSPIDDLDIVKQVYPEATGEWVFFSRLNVPEGFRDKSVCFRLMQYTVDWADKHQFNILDGLNPYGRLSLDNLIIFNQLYGFKYIKDNMMVRICR
jgi:hypothetical protein